MATLAALYAPDHPYHWLTIGSVDDLRASDARRSARVLLRALPSGQRVAGHRGRHRARARLHAGGAVLRRAAPRSRKSRARCRRRPR
jgi:hypothetical protein